MKNAINFNDFLKIISLSCKNDSMNLKNLIDHYHGYDEHIAEKKDTSFSFGKSFFELFYSSDSEFRLIEENGLIRITKNGLTISKAYKEIKPVMLGNHLLLMIGSSTLERFLTFDGYQFIESEAKSHDFKYDDKINKIVGNLGACSYIFDPFTGKFISKGYHYLFMENGSIYGKLGARKERVQWINEG